jgi:hypothetical protein
VGEVSRTEVAVTTVYNRNKQHRNGIVEKVIQNRNLNAEKTLHLRD